MYPAEFDYHRADSVEHAVELLADDPEAEVLAGGHSLLPMMKTGMATPPAVVDVGEIDDLRGLSVDGDATRIGALTTYATVASDDVLRERCRVVPETAHAIGDIQVRNRGTVGGNVAHGDPASDLPAATLAADATFVVHGPDGERTVSADDFFHGMFATDLAPDELLVEIVVPHHDGGQGATENGGAETGSAYVKRASPSSGYAIVGVAAVLETDGETVESARVAANGVQQHAFRLEPVEDALVGAGLDADALEAAADRAAEAVDEFMVMDDRQASGEFRTHLLGEYTRRALVEAADRVGAPTPSAP